MGNFMDEENDIDSEEDESGEEENGEIESIPSLRVEEDGEILW